MFTKMRGKIESLSAELTYHRDNFRAYKELQDTLERRVGLLAGRVTDLELHHIKRCEKCGLEIPEHPGIASPLQPRVNRRG